MPPNSGVECCPPFEPDLYGETLPDLRSNIGHVLAAAGGVLLFIFLLLPWLSGGGVTFSAWKVFSGIDIVLALLAIATAVTAGAYLAGQDMPAPWLGPQVLKWLGVIALTIVLTFALEIIIYFQAI